MLNGRPISDYRPSERARRCAVMRQDNARPSGMTVLEAVELGRLAYGADEDVRSLAWEMLGQMDLADLAGRDCSRLSGGEWQRVAFARTVAHGFRRKPDSAPRPRTGDFSRRVNHCDGLLPRPMETGLSCGLGKLTKARRPPSRISVMRQP